MIPDILTRTKTLTGLTALGLLTACGGTSRADSYQSQPWLVRIDDLGESLCVSKYLSGGKISGYEAQTGGSPFYVAFGESDIISSYGRLLSDVRIAINIYESDGGMLSDTWLIDGEAGRRFVVSRFLSSHEGFQPEALENPTLSLIESDAWQTVAHFDLSNGYQFDWEFRSSAPRNPHHCKYPTVPEASGNPGLLAFGFVTLVVLNHQTKRYR
jgi:hypothetical protein